MANYVVAYTINSDSSKGGDFSNFLAEIGLKETVDQSTRYGNYEGGYKALQDRLKSKCANLQLTNEDTVYLFSAGRNNNLTIKKSTVK